MLKKTAAALNNFLMFNMRTDDKLIFIVRFFVKNISDKESKSF